MFLRLYDGVKEKNEKYKLLLREYQLALRELAQCRDESVLQQQFGCVDTELQAYAHQLAELSAEAKGKKGQGHRLDTSGAVVDMLWACLKEMARELWVRPQLVFDDVPVYVQSENAEELAAVAARSIKVSLAQLQRRMDAAAEELAPERVVPETVAAAADAKMGGGAVCGVDDAPPPASLDQIKEIDVDKVGGGSHAPPSRFDWRKFDWQKSRAWYANYSKNLMQFSGKQKR